MAQQADLQSILAALAARSAPNPSQPPTQQHPGAQIPPYSTLQTPTPLPAGFQLPQPINAGNLDLSAIRPINTGSVSLNDALAKARNFAAEKGLAYDSNRSDSRDGRPYRRSRSGSRSPPRRDTYNSYRDDRRDDSRRGYGRDRSRSPVRGSRNPYSPQPGRSYGRDRSPRRDDDSEVINIDSNLVGLVIGRQGENLRRVEQETSARIQFITPADHPGPQRQCRISGPVRARNDAKREIFRIIEENNAAHSRDPTRGAALTGNRQPPPPPQMQMQQQQPQGTTKLPSQPVLREGEDSMQIMVPDRTVGLIIGRGGETIRDLQERSGCHINIVGVNKSVNGLRPVNLIGSVQAATKAKDLIMEIVESDTRGPNAQTDEAPRPAQQTVEPAVSHGKISETIKVPSDAVGMIIGKGGETIKEMQSTTNCKINVSQASGADIEREIGLVGAHAAIEAAKKAIWEKVDMVREKSRNPGGRDGGDRYGQQQYGQQQQQQYGGQSYNQSYGNQQQQSPAAADTADPYAAYGGYQNYVALWYAAVANGTKVPGQDGAPGPGV